MPQSVKVVLCICTCRRPAGLARLLAAVADLDYADELSVVVVDNDPAAEGAAVCERLRPTYRWPLNHVVEEQRGISFARNRAVAAALAQEPDFIAMLDDDERPCRAWLRELLLVQIETSADVVAGPVIPEFSVPPPDWIRRGRFFDLAEPRVHGNSCFVYCTGNFIARTACFRALLPHPFDPAFALTGGSDLLFFSHLRSLEYAMQWAPRAVVCETIPETRMSLGWLQRRHFRNAIANVRVQRMFAPGFRNEAARIAKTVAGLVAGFCLYVAAWPDRCYRVRGSLMMYRALGKLAAYRGRLYLEYHQIHGN